MGVFRERDLWRHQAGVLVVAFLVLSLSRSVGALDDPAHLRTIAAQSLVMVVIALPFQTGGALLSFRLLGDRVSARHASLLGCVLAAIPSTGTAMVLIWLIALPPLDGGEMRSHILDWMAAWYPPALILHATLGSLLWMVLSFPWWRTRFARPGKHHRVLPEGLDVPAAGSNAFPRNEAARQPEFLRRLSPQNSGTLWAISSERHYVRIQTETGNELLLMRLADAIEQCRYLDGIRIHRSHWVNRPGVKCVLRDGDKLVVHLKDGRTLPVSRSHRSEVLTFINGMVSNEA